MMGKNSYAIDPSAFGLPDLEGLREMRIWDLHYHGLSRHNQMLPYFERMGVERVFSLEAATLQGMSPEEAEESAAENLQLVAEDRDFISGMIRIDPARVDDTLEYIDRLIAKGPCVGIKTGEAHPEPVTVAHKNYDPIIRKLAELEAVIYIHTGFLVGGDPRSWLGGNRVGESNPSHVAELASRFPDVSLICGHQGADWELGVRAIRPHKNVLMEFSGMDPESGAIDFAVKELGEDRIVWGSHAHTRSFANELSKIYDGDLTDRQRKKIFGENLRKLSAAVHERKGISVTV